MELLCSGLLPSSTHECCIRAARAEKAKPAAQTVPFCSTKSSVSGFHQHFQGERGLKQSPTLETTREGKKKIQAKLICRLANTASALGVDGTGKTSPVCPWEDKIPPAVSEVSSEPRGARGGRDRHLRTGAEGTRRGTATASSTVRQTREAA